MPALCVALEQCCRHDALRSRECAESPEQLAEHGISRWTCAHAARAWEAERRAGEDRAPPAGCGPLLSSLRAASRAPLAEAETRCDTDAECVVLAAGREDWCNADGVPVAVARRAAPEVRARLEVTLRRSTDTRPLVCPLPLARCIRGACELDWGSAR